MSNVLPIEQILVYGNMSATSFYKTPVWRAARYNALTVQGNRCGLCGASAANGPLHVDHIKPRFLFPDLCLDPTNLQVLCEDCHIAKGIKYTDDCRKKFTQLQAIELRDFFRLEQRHMALAHRPPRNRTEVDYFGVGARTANRKHKRKWHAFVNFCFHAKLDYPIASQISVGDFMQVPCTRGHIYGKFLYMKTPNDFAFDIAGCLFPKNIRDLLADDQRGGAL